MNGRFVYLVDTHWTREPGVPPHAGLWQKELFDTHCERLEEAAVDLVKRLSPDFVIHGGDLCREAKESDWRNARRVMDRFGCPYYFVPGNHDIAVDADRARLVEIFEVPEDRLHVVREIGGLRFIFLDSTYVWRRDAARTIERDDPDFDPRNQKGIGVSPEEVAWFGEVLSESDPAEPLVVVTHCPMVGAAGYSIKYRKEKPITASLPEWDPRWLVPIHDTWVMPLEQRRADLLHIMRESGNVRVVLAGHQHGAHISLLDGVLHCTMSAMSAWPFEMRLIAFDDEGMTIDTVQVDAPDLIKASYRPDWGNEWVAGVSEYDRKATVRWDRCV